MTEALTPLFEGKQIRVIEKDGETWIPCKDLGIALGLNRSTLYHHIQRNRDFFGETAIDGDKLSPGEGDYWVNEQGLYLLLARISIGRITPGAKSAVIKFRKDIPVFLQQYRRKELVQTGSVDLEIRQARHIAELTGGDLRQFQAAALRKCGLPEYADALLSGIPALAHGETGWFNPSQLGERCGLTARELNSWLYNHGFQYPQGPVWRLQPTGELHGEEYWFEATSGHREIRIRWRLSILKASGLKKDEPAALPAATAGA